MASLPLLLFPSPEKASKTPGHGFGGNIKRPSAQKQWERLSPTFQQLQESFNARCVELQQTPAGIDPEQVLVIKIIGGIKDFANAVKRIPGLEWMGEIELEEIAPDEDFYDEKKPKKKLGGRLYLVMTNQQALTQMLSLWKRYQADTSMKFERGLTKFRDVFLYLKELRQWGIEDRLAEREVFKIWEEDLEFNKNKNVRFEAELWYRKSEAKRNESERAVSELIQRLDGKIKSRCVIPSIAYHSILGEIPTQAAQQIIKHPKVDLLQCDNIMFFRPTGQMATGRQPAADGLIDCTVSKQSLPAGDPTVAVLDGLPLENHSLLSGRLIVDDPDDWASEYPAIDRQHGTAMTSLVVHGDLNNSSSPLNRPVYVRPIMKPAPWHQSPRPEHVPDDILFVDYIHRAVKRIVEGSGDDEAAAPTVKIINLSIGDRCRHFSQIISPLARLLDWLSVKYNILFIVSAGNHSESLNTDISTDSFNKLTPEEREELIVTKIYDDARHRRLLAPGESINGLTIGAYHHDGTADIKPNALLDVFETLLPSPISAFGSGYRRAIKPDFLYHGGKVLLSSSLYHPNNAQLSIPDILSLRGNATATPSSQAGELSKQKYSCGTSNATALTTRAAGICYDALLGLFSEQIPEENFSVFGVQLLKAMLVHGCSWDEIGDNLERILCTNRNGRQIKNLILRWVGYGIPDIAKTLGCTDQRATLLGFGKLGDGEAHAYKLPLPPSLTARTEWRKFTVTLAWLSPIAPTTQKYRAAQLWFDFEDGKKSREKLKKKLRVTGIDSDSNATRRGTVQHEIFEGESAVAITDGDILQIKVNCREDARKIESPVAYGLVVSLEVAEGIDIPIYNEVRTRIAPAVEIRA